MILNKIQTSQQTYSITITKISRIMLFVVITTNNTVRVQLTFMLKQVGARNHWRRLLCAPPGLKPKILRSAHTVYLRVLCGSENKQRSFPYTALTDWFI
jgi:hypothetical protein